MMRNLYIVRKDIFVRNAIAHWIAFTVSVSVFTIISMLMSLLIDSYLYIILLALVISTFAFYFVFEYGVKTLSKAKVMSVLTNVRGKFPYLNKNATSYNDSGYVYYLRQEYELAIADYDKAIALNPEYTAAYTNRGNVYYAQQEYDRAIADYDKAIALNPEYAAAYYNRGNVYYIQKNFGRAIADYGKAIALNPKYAITSSEEVEDDVVEDYGEAIEFVLEYATAYSGQLEEEIALIRQDIDDMTQYVGVLSAALDKAIQNQSALLDIFTRHNDVYENLFRDESILEGDVLNRFAQSFNKLLEDIEKTGLVNEEIKKLLQESDSEISNT